MSLSASIIQISRDKRCFPVFHIFVMRNYDNFVYTHFSSSTVEGAKKTLLTYCINFFGDEQKAFYPKKRTEEMEKIFFEKANFINLCK